MNELLQLQGSAVRLLRLSDVHRASSVLGMQKTLGRWGLLVLLFW